MPASHTLATGRTSLTGLVKQMICCNSFQAHNQLLVFLVFILLGSLVLSAGLDVDISRGSERGVQIGRTKNIGTVIITVTTSAALHCTAVQQNNQTLRNEVTIKRTSFWFIFLFRFFLYFSRWFHFDWLKVTVCLLKKEIAKPAVETLPASSSCAQRNLN